MPSNERIQKGISSSKQGQTDLRNEMAENRIDVSEEQFLDAMKAIWETEFPSLALSFHPDKNISEQLKATVELFRKALEGVCPSHVIFIDGDEKSYFEKCYFSSFVGKYISPNLLQITAATNREDGYNPDSSDEEENYLRSKISALQIELHDSNTDPRSAAASRAATGRPENKPSKTTGLTFPFRLTKSWEICVISFHLEVNSSGNGFQINVKSAIKKAFEIFTHSISNRMKVPNKRLPPKDSAVEQERLFTESILTSIFRALDTSPKGWEFYFPCKYNDLYDEDLYKGLLNEVSKEKPAKFDFNWIEKFAVIESDKDKRSVKTFGNNQEDFCTRCKILSILCVKMGLDQKFTVKLWKKGKNKMALALFAYKIAKDIYEPNEGSEKGDKMKHQMEYFQNLTIKLLKRCYSEDNNATFELLLGRIPDLHHVTPIDIALDADFNEFIAEKSCRKLLDRLWIDPLENHNKKYYINFLISLILPFLSPLLMNFAAESKLLAKEVLEIASEENKDFRDHYSITEYCCISAAKAIDEALVGQLGDKINAETPEKGPSGNEEKKMSCLNKICCVLCLPIWIPYIICSHYFWLIRCFLIAPVVRFIYYAISHLAYLILFSVVMLSDFTKDFNVKEFILCLWTLIIAIEELKQMIQTISAHHSYLDKWNILDNSGLLLFLIGFILRMIALGSCPECLFAARIVFTFSLMVFILRTLQLLSIDTRLGPKIYMMGSLLRDLISFMLILSVFVVAYGVGSNIILYPNQPINIDLLKDIFYDSWWSVLGQPNRDDVLGEKCNKDPQKDNPNITAGYCSLKNDTTIDYAECKKNKCPSNSWIVAILLVVYAIITVVMMLNILIAMFNDTYSRVHQKRNEVYNLQSYKLMREYCGRPAYPAPLCVITYWRVVPWLIQCCCRMKCTEDKDAQRRKAITIFSRKLSSKAKIIEEKYNMDDGDKVAEDELSDFKDMVSKLDKEDFNRVKLMISALSNKQT